MGESSMTDLRYRRVLIKLSGEALMGRQGFGIDPEYLGRLAVEILSLVQAGAQIALVVGGGNIFRGANLAKAGLDRVTADQMGMLATVMNALAMQDAMEHLGLKVRVMSALSIQNIGEGFSCRRALSHLEQGRVVVFAAGTGNPFFTTDSAASLRAVEIGAEMLIKATKVDGIYSADPVTDSSALFYPVIDYDQALNDKLGVMDATAIVMCRDHGLPVRIMNINQAGALKRLLQGEDIGSLVTRLPKND